MVRRLGLLTALLVALMAPAIGAAQTTVILVRHADKAEAPANDPPLDPSGTKRAAHLAESLGAANVSVVYTTPYARARQTAAPVAAAFKLQAIETPVNAQYAQELAARIKKNDVGKTVLVVGHSNTTPAVVKALTGVDVPPIPETDYFNLYVVTIAADGKTGVIRARY